MLKKLSLLIAVAAFGTACSSISSFQGAQTVKSGETSHTVGFGTLSSDTASDVAGLEVDENDTSGISVPMFEYMFRYGINDSMDFGLRTTGWVHGGDFKWKFMDGPFSMATGIGFSRLSITSEGTTSSSEFSATDIYVPLYMEYATSDSLSFYITPKYMNRSYTSEFTDSTDASLNSESSSSIGFTGASLGLKWGKEWGVILEYSTMSGSVDDDAATTTIDESADITLTQTGLAFFFN